MKLFDNTTPHLSSAYDGQILNTVPNYEQFHQTAARIAEAAEIHPKIWLDTGGGTGTFVKVCLDIFPDTLFLLADPSEEMLSEARKKLGAYGEERVRILPPVSTQNLALTEDLRPDLITAIQAHHYLTAEERRKATMVCFDLLRQDGMFITFENIRPFSGRGIEIGKRYWSDFQRTSGKSEDQIIKHMERFGTEYFPINIEEHLNLYRECGFETAELLWYSYMQAGFYCIK